MREKQKLENKAEKGQQLPTICDRQLTFATSNVSITHKARLAATDHGAQGQSIDHFTDGIGTARMCDIARVLALAIEAGQLAGAFGIHGAALWLHWQQFTTHCGISTVSSGTATLCTMIVHTTLGSYATVARILTTFIAAGQVEGAFIVAATLRTLATHQRISTISIGAMAAGTMIEVGTADGTSSTLCEATRIHALLIDARLGGSTFAIGATAKKVAMLQCVASVSLIAHAQWTMQLHVATCLLSAEVRLLARITADLIEAGLVIATLRITGTFRFGWIQLGHLAHTLCVRGAIELWRTTADGLVIDHTANGIQTTSMLARIAALLTDAGAISRAILIGHTLRIAAGGSSIVDAANSITATRRWLARIDRIHLTWCLALHEGVANHFVGTTADGTVIDGLADGSVATNAGTGINTLGVDTRTILGTVRAECALGATALTQRITEEARQALAHSLITLYAANGVQSTWRGVARIRFGWWCYHTCALQEGVACVTCGARTDRNVIVHIAQGLQAAGTRARISALVAYAGSVGRTLRVAHTLGATTLVGIANVLLNAFTHKALATQAALCVAATRRWVARILGFWWRCWTSCKGITSIRVRG